MGLTLSKNITSIEMGTFTLCESLENVTLPDELILIGDKAFHECTGLVSIDIPNSVTTIGYQAFSFCSSLTSVTFGKGVTTLDWRIVSWCENLTEIRFTGDAPEFGEYTFDELTVTAYYPAGNTTWTADVRQDYGGDITWRAYNVADGTTVTTDTLCVRRGNTFFINYELKGGDADMSFTYGRDTDEVLVGDWDGGVDTICLRRGNVCYFIDDITTKHVYLTVTYGRSDDEVLVGDWDANGTDTLAMRRNGNTYFISNSIASPDSGVDTFTFGRAGDEVYAGKWK